MAEIKASVNRIMGAKEIPPNRGTAPVCIFLSSGISNNLFVKATIRIRGIISIEKIIDIAKAIKIKRYIMRSFKLSYTTMFVSHIL